MPSRFTIKSIRIDLLALIRSLLMGVGMIWMFIEPYEGLENKDFHLDYWLFLLMSFVFGAVIYVIDGLLLSGYMVNRATIRNDYVTTLTVEFGDIFEKDGWTAISVSDFFNSTVDEELVSSKSLHGIVLNRFWAENAADWQRQIDNSLRSYECETVQKRKGNKRQYPVGTTAKATVDGRKFLFVALGRADENHVTSNNAEGLICAVRGMLTKARATCSSEPLNIPLMGAGLARIGVKEAVLTDLIITAVLEESRYAKVTNAIRIVLPLSLRDTINVKQYESKWS
ncbi:DUF6430 domain-containing protein [Phaeobacter inhibens]|uniref:macro domain-containing protein n=1 Tax=Phaeobacter inhibens TaxID=221822 RepID=UPI0026E21E6F|nr:macro domain-containing protein [Phaeobacter inhibens]MDO6758522.1 DUF6430 domain-containing protein [Phaeobacter inhibens]